MKRQIEGLERELGEPMFHRLGRGVRLTDGGRIMLPHIERALAALRSARALAAVDAMQQESLKEDTDRLSAKDIDAEIKAVRKGRRR